MIEVGWVMESPLIGHEFRFSGHRFHILESSRDTKDGSLRFQYFAPSRAHIPEHVHTFQEERFEIVSGTLGVRVGGRRSILRPGQSAVGPPRVPHKWWNPSEHEEVCFRAGIRPGLDVEIMLETLLGLMRDGKTIRSIPRNPLQLAMLVREIGAWAYPLGLPMPVRRALFTPVVLLAFVGSVLGYRVSYPEYSGPQAKQG
jgi:mannose-6-phosphate isomerase-like protein (cupin superfamily)